MVELDLIERVQPALQQLRVLGAYGIEAGTQRGGNSAVPPKEYRESIFEGLRMAGDTWGAFWGTLGRVLANDVLENPTPSLARKLDRDSARRKDYPYFGEWTSAAGRLVAGVQPRSKAGVYPVLAITEHSLHIVCVQRRRGSLAKLGPAIHETWRIAREDLSWLRECGGAAYEFGFRDGSWATVNVFRADAMRQFFPDMLTEGATIPW